MKKLIIGSLLLSALSVCAQQSKSPLDSGVYRQWPSLAYPYLSADGKYVHYKLLRGSSYAANIQDEAMVLQSTDAKWKLSLPGISSCEFTADSRYAVYTSSGDSLIIQQLGMPRATGIPGVSSFRLSGDWLVYKRNGQIIAHNMRTDRKHVYDHNADFVLSPDGTTLLMESPRMLRCIQLPDGAERTIWEGDAFGGSMLDERHSGWLAFMADNACWYYKKGMMRAEKLLDATTPGIAAGLRPDRPRKFSSDGTRLFVDFRDPQEAPDPEAVRLDVWHYKDTRLQAQQLDQTGDRFYTHAVFLDSKRLVRLQQEGEPGLPLYAGGNDDHMLTSQYTIASGTAQQYESWLLSTKDGSKKSFPFGGTVSYAGKYLVYFDPVDRNFFSFEIATGITRNLTKDIRTQWHATEGYAVRGSIAGWLEHDEAMLVYDMYDIWQIDMAGKAEPVNLTNGYGRSHHTMFSLCREDYKERPVRKNDQLIVTAFNLDNKQNGYARITINETRDPAILIMDDHAWDITRNPYVINDAHYPLCKAKDAEMYILQRQRADESPNFFSTTNFSALTRLTDLRPEKAYNWYTTELLQWRQQNGELMQAVLYKPENFDPAKKYPVIFYYYERRSDNLNVYMKPEPSDGRLNIAWYASNGYLVCMPDIHYMPGEAMKSCYNSVTSCAKYCSTLPYVNADKMAIQGISWGGYETNYLVTHSSLFAAACSASGVADFISAYNGHTHGGSNSQARYEFDKMGPGASLWERPEWYVENSPIMSAHRVTTPLLMFHTSFDGACPYPQAVELFNALRRLGKKVWLLEYNDGNHGVMGKNAMDFDLRMQQFFNHYLKDAPAPMWMTKGRPASLKGIETRLELDASGAKP